MASKKNQNDGPSGLGLALAAAAAAGVYFLYGTNDAKKNRKAVKGWALKAKGEVLEKIEQVKGELTEENYHKIVDTVTGKYRKLKTAHGDDVEMLVKDMKGHWKNIKKHVGGAQATVKKATKKAVKVAKKAAK